MSFLGPGTKGRVEGCDIAGNKSAGVAIVAGADPIIVSCKIRDGGSYGVTFLHAKGRLERNLIAGNQLSGLDIGAFSDPTIVDNRVHDGRSAGVRLHGFGTKGRLDCNDIARNVSYGILITGGAKSCLRRGVLRRNTICHNNGFGVFVYGSSDPLLSSNTISRNTCSNVYFSDNGTRGRLTFNSIFGSESSGVSVDEDANPDIFIINYEPPFSQ